MGQGTSRLNWVCSCEDGKFNLTATYEEQKFNHTQTPVEEYEEKNKSQTKNKHATNENTSTVKDTLLPIMDVETNIDDSSKGTKLRRTYSSCDLEYTKPTPDSKKIQRGHSGKNSGSNNKNKHQYRSHEVLYSAGSSSTNTESSGLSQSNSENSLNSTKNVDSKLHRKIGTSNLHKTKQEQNDQLNKQKANNTQQPTPERKLSINSSTSTGSTDRKSSIGDISSLSELLKKKKKEARRAEIVAAVTKRLYNARKKVDVKPEPVEVVPEQEDKLENEDEELEELKLCSRARTKLQELSKRALFAHRGKMKRYSDMEAQTDFDKHVLRVKEVAVSTEEIYHPPSMLFLDNRNFLLTNCAYPSMRQPSPWSTVSVRNHNSLSFEDNFSDDSLDSNHEMDITEAKPSLWDVISISSGKQFKTNENGDGLDQISNNISTQTISSNDDETIVSVLEDEKVDNFNICINGIDISAQENDCTGEGIESNNTASDRDQIQQSLDFCRDSPENDTCAEESSLQKIDRHLYTITENNEISDCNDMLLSDFENSYVLNCHMNQKPVTVIEKSENMPNIQGPSEDTNFCKLAENNHKSCQTCTCDIASSLFNETVSSCVASCAADISCRNHNPERHHYKDKITQTITKKKTTSVLNTANKISDTEVNKETRPCCQVTEMSNESYKKMCKECGKFQADSYSLIKNIETKSVQCNNLPSNETNNTHFPNLSVLCTTLLGAYHQLLQLSNPSLQSEDSIGIFFNGLSSQTTVMKSVQWGKEQEHDTVGTQTDQNKEQRSAEANSHHIQSSFHMEVPCDRARGSKRKTKTCHKSLSQFANEQSISNQNDTISHPKGLQTGQQRKTGENSTMSDSWEMENFSNEDDVPLLPRSTVSSTQGAEASGYQHWTEIKNLILGSGKNLFSYNTTDDNSLPIRHPKNVKKKSVSWSDLSGCGALQTEMVFTSDHNLFDSSQASQNKITKSSLRDIITTEPSHERQVMTTSQLDGCRKQSRKLHRRWSLSDTNELSSKQPEGKLHLSTFLKEASTLVSSLGQATRLLQKGHQLNIRSSKPETFKSIHNELWLSDDNYFSHSPSFETQFRYSSPTSLPTIMSSDAYDYGRFKLKKNSFRHHRNYLQKFKVCNINTQMRLNQNQWDRRQMNDLCEQEINRTTSLPDCSMLETNKWCSACSIHHSMPHLTTILDSDSSLVKPHSFYSSYMLSSPRAYRQHLVAIRRQIIEASLPIVSTK